MRERAPMLFRPRPVGDYHTYPHTPTVRQFRPNSGILVLLVTASTDAPMTTYNRRTRGRCEHTIIPMDLQPMIDSIDR